MRRSFKHSALGRSRLRLGSLSMAGLIALVAGGCQSYERRPMDLTGHHAAFLARTPESPEVTAFAESLAAR